MTKSAAHRTAIGIGCKLLNGFFFALLGLLMNYCAASGLPLSEVLFMRLALGAVMTIVLIKATSGSIPLSMPFARVKLYGLRAIVNYSAFYTLVYAIGQMGPNEATTLIALHPFWSCILAQIMCREKFDRVTLIVLCMNLIGVYLSVGARFNVQNPHVIRGTIAAISSSVLWAFHDIICKKQTDLKEGVSLQTLYSYVATLVLAAPHAALQWKPISGHLFLVLSGIAAIGVLSIITLFLSFCYASVVTLAPFSSTRMICTFIISALIHGAAPSASLLFGSALLVVASTYYFIIKTKDAYVPAHS